MQLLDTSKHMAIKQRITELEALIDYLEKEIPCRRVRNELENTRKLFNANVEMLHFLFGESYLKQ